MFKLFRTTVILSLISSPLLFAKVVDKTVAIVNGEAIMFSEFDKVAAPIIQQYKQATPEAEQTPERLKDLKQKLIEQMVDDKVLKQEAKKNKIKVNKREIEEGIKQVKKRFKDENEFNEELKKENINSMQFEKRIEEQLTVMKLIEKEVKEKAEKPTDDQVKAFYDKIQSKIAGKNLGLEKKEEEEIASLASYISKMSAEQVHARHILIQLDKKGTIEAKSAALKRVKKVQEQLKSGADFEELAKKYSDDPGSKMQGGDLGFFAKGSMVPEFDKVAFSLNVGQISDPVLTDFGYHIIKIEEKRASKKVTLDDLKNDLKELLFQKTAQKRYESWMKDLKAKANIKINPLD